MKKNNRMRIFETNSDIVSILYITETIGWTSLKEVNLFRILYLSAVMYNFYFNEASPFEENYDFIISVRGPYSENIQNSLLYLKSNGFINENSKQELSLNSSVLSNEKIVSTEVDSKKSSWFETVIYIIGIYGEEKLYDFIIRDPEYVDTFERNTNESLSISANNETAVSLSLFKQQFEQNLSIKKSDLSDQKYLELYFEYVFSKILRGVDQ